MILVRMICGEARGAGVRDRRCHLRQVLRGFEGNDFAVASPPVALPVGSGASGLPAQCPVFNRYRGPDAYSRPNRADFRHHWGWHGFCVWRARLVCGASRPPEEVVTFRSASRSHRPWTAPHSECAEDIDETSLVECSKRIATSSQRSTRRCTVFVSAFRALEDAAIGGRTIVEESRT